MASLFARLALYPDRAHAREELAELLWPGAEPARARNRLRNALSTLRRLLDLPDLPADAVLIADRRGVRLNGSVVHSDVVAFERHVQRREFDAARACYAGPLLPGLYDPWIEDERSRLAALFDRLAAPVDEGVDDRPKAAAVARAAAAPAPAAQHVPRYPTSFVGRAEELRLLAGLTARARLVTITGPAGCGKTRLALEHAARTSGFDRVTWVPLVSCAAPPMVLEHVRSALCLQAGATLPLEQIAANLEDRAVLLVLDNLEHLLAANAAAPFIDQLLERLPRLRILATSQRVPHCGQGEALALRPLAIPTREENLAGAGRAAAVQLFVQRARDRRADFTLHARNARDLVSICRTLEGLPLAIELAAARVRHVALRDMSAALGSSVLALGKRHRTGDARDRHASVAHAIGWTWNLLDAPQRDALAALSILRGDFDVATAAAMADWKSTATRAHVQALEAFSLLQSRPDGGGVPRWGMLAPLRAFAQSQLTDEAAARARARHRAWFLAKARELAAYSRAVDAAELPDFLYAIETGLDDADADTAAATALALRPEWISHGAPAQALELLGRIADRTSLQLKLRAAIASMVAPLLLDAGRADDARKRADKAVRLARGVSPHAEIDAALARIQVKWRARRDGEEVLSAAREALQRARALGAHELIGRACMSLGAITWAHLKDPAQARALFVEAEHSFEAHGDPRAALTALPGHVACLLLQDRAREAAALAERGVEQAHRFHDVQTELLLLNRLADCFARGRRYARAAQACRRLVDLSQRHGLSYHLAYAMWNLALPLARQGQAEAAALLMAFSQRYWTDRFGAMHAEDGAYIEHVRAAVVRHLGRRAWEALWERGQALPLAEGIALARG